MGHDISIIARHHLDTSSIQALGEDISTRKQINVKCLAQKNYELDLEAKGGFPTFEEIDLGNIHFSEDSQNWSLYDDNYMAHQYFNDFGDKLFDHQFFKDNPLAVEEFQNQRNLTYNLYYKFDGDSKQAYIYQNLWECDIHYFSRWYDLCRVFMKKNWPYSLKNFIEYRKELKKTIELFGGYAVVYLDDQGESQEYIYSACDATNWDDYLAEIKQRFGGKLLNIPEFIAKNQPLENGDYPLAFYDDFSDLK